MLNITIKNILFALGGAAIGAGTGVFFTKKSEKNKFETELSRKEDDIRFLFEDYDMGKILSSIEDEEVRAAAINKISEWTNGYFYIREADKYSSIYTALENVLRDLENGEYGFLKNLAGMEEEPDEDEPEKAVKETEVNKSLENEHEEHVDDFSNSSDDDSTLEELKEYQVYSYHKYARTDSDVISDDEFAKLYYALVGKMSQQFLIKWRICLNINKNHDSNFTTKLDKADELVSAILAATEKNSAAEIKSANRKIKQYTNDFIKTLPEYVSEAINECVEETMKDKEATEFYVSLPRFFMEVNWAFKDEPKEA